MTENQSDSLRNKIKRIKKDLAADKRKGGGYYDDSRGLRYLPPRLYIKLGDYKGGLRYLRWFDRTFKDDIGFPEYLFDSTIILFMSGRLPEAEDMAIRTYRSNPYLFDRYLGKDIVEKDIFHSISFMTISYAESLDLKYSRIDLSEFTEWLNYFLESDKFREAIIESPNL
jgi:hypothetical protein